MKKRIVSIIVVMMLLVSMLSGCGLITLNAERDGAQVVSTVEVDGMNGAVTKADLVGFFNQLGYLYVQYYGWTVDKVINEFVDQLSDKEILVLYATKDIASEKGIDLNEVKNANNKYVENVLNLGTKKHDANIRPYDLFNLFGADEQFYVIKQTKKALKSTFEQIVKEVEDEKAANAPEEEEEEKPEEDKTEEEVKKLEARTQKTLTPNDKFEADASITAETVNAEKTFFEEMDAKVAAKELTDIEVEAYNKMKSRIEKNYDSLAIAWNTMLDNQKEARLLEKYRDKVNAGLAVEPSEVISRYNYTVTNNLTTVFDKASYKTAIEADKNNDILVHNNETGYFTVKSILLKFNEEQTKALEAIKSGVLSDTDDKQAISNLRGELATDTAFSVVGVGNNIGGIKVNVSNPNYDPNATCKDKDCECVECTNSKNYKKGAVCENKDCKCVACVHHAYDRYDVAYTEILNEMSLALANAKNVNFKDADVDEATKTAGILNAKMDVFDDYIYLVNDDPGMFNSTGYVVNDNGASTYVAEYVALCRELAKKAKADNTVGVVGGLGEMTVANPFNEKDPAIQIYAIKAENGEEINYIVNDFGIHIVMVTYVAKDNGDANNKIDAKTYKYGLDTVVKYENVYVTDDKGKVVLDENGQKTIKEVKNLTVGKRFENTILDEKKNEFYSKKEKEITDSYDEKITKNDKLIKDVIKEIEKAIGGNGAHNHEGHNH